MKLRISLATLVVALTTAASAAPTMAAPAFGPPDSPVHPGVQTFTGGQQCTANFVFTNGTDAFIGQAAHCSGTDGNTATNGCRAGSMPIGTAVEIDGATRPGTLVYNSWITMQQTGETDANACQYNDFALVKIDPADVSRTNPSIPSFGGPNGVTATVASGARVLSYGNSGLRFGAAPLSPKEGVSLGQTGGGRTHTVYTVTPGIPGDSGSAFIDGQGRAFGVLSTVALLPVPASNGVSDLSRALSYAAARGAFSVSLVNGDVPFKGGLLPL